MGNIIKSTNPYNGELLKVYQSYSEGQLEEILERAEVCHKSWSVTDLKHRTSLLVKLGDAIQDGKTELAKLVTSEMGKPIAQSIAELDKCIWLCDFYWKNASQFLADELIETDASETFISYDPLGCILAIMPWNYPFWQVMRFAVPTLTAGNTALLKHATNVSGCAIAIQELFEKAGYPKGCFQTILTDHGQIEQLLAHDTVKAVSLTGSEKAGKAIAAIAGKYLKKSVLELGGNNACVVWEDADLDGYIDTMVQARMQNTGQSCIAAKRFIVVEAVYERFLEKFKAAVADLKTGDPSDGDTYIGVMAREDLADILSKQISDSIDQGAEVVYGNKRNGTYYEPTILTKVRPGMPVFDEETFGPIAAVTKAKDRDEAIALARDSRFGLGTMLFTEDIEAARKMIPRIPDGALFINDMVKSDPRLPFGGTKASGFGRELSREGIYEFVNKKTVYIK